VEGPSGRSRVLNRVGSLSDSCESETLTALLGRVLGSAAARREFSTRIERLR
jgi:hypothetical protein